MGNILLIEDDKTLAELYATVLKEKGHTLDVAHDGVEGLAKAIQNHPELIITDIAMPKMDGVTMMKHIREDE